MKITTMMRKMVNDREFFEAVCALVHAEENLAVANAKLREIIRLDRENAAHRMNYQADLCNASTPTLTPSLVAATCRALAKAKPL